MDAAVARSRHSGPRSRVGPLSVAEVVEEALTRARAAQQRLNAFAVVDEEGSRKRADELDQLPVTARGALHGVPVTVKDLFNVAGLTTRAGTRAALPALGPDESPLVARLRTAGAVIVGKTNLHEAALGLTGDNPWTGAVRNPHDPSRMAGGSSSGAAAALGAGVGLGALATDTAGSIRLPASFCGVVGFKPTYGVLPLDGALPLSPSLDHAGPIAGCVADARLMFEALAGVQQPTGRELGGRAPIFAVPMSFLEGRLISEVEAAFIQLLRRLTEAGAQVREVDVPRLGSAPTIQTPVGWPEAHMVHHAVLATSPEDFSPQVRASLEMGGRITAVEYLRATAERKRLAADLADCFQDAGADAIVMPAAPFPAPRLGSTEVTLPSGTVAYRDAVLPLLTPFSLTGLPTVSLPMAWLDGLPVNAQVVAPRGADSAALDIAAWVESVEEQR
jgi:aspartyl-tRNA(Asn)/glutamyl-tRNA(Gln) amidotransferase subunit A